MTRTVYDYQLKDIHGNDFFLSKFKGKKILLVNTASACGFTPQYKQLEELYENFNDKVEIVGLPCDDFGGQEPGNEAEIEQFCEVNYHISFPMTSKIKILGSSPHPLYEFLMKKELNGYRDSEVKWNFQKYLIDENGSVIKIFSPAMDPLAEEILNLIQK